MTQLEEMSLMLTIINFLADGRIARVPDGEIGESE